MTSLISIVKTPEQLIDQLIAVEGGYTNNSNDSGGETMFGITVAVARAHGYKGAMKDMPRQTAVDIYTAEYWIAPGFAEVYTHYPRVAAELLDTGVNAGVSRAVMFWQRCLNALYGCGLAVDGGMKHGGATLLATAAPRAHHTPDDEGQMVKLLNCYQGELYSELVEKNQKNRTFLFGWLANRVVV